jgi:iron complex outermembrane receptor protein
MDSGINLAVYGKNIFDEFYWVGGFPLGFIQGTNTAIPGKPRTWGVEVGYRY